MIKKKIFYCQNCNNKFYKWMGCCNFCNQWNTLKELINNNINNNFFNSEKNNFYFLNKSEPISIQNILYSEEDRFSTKDLEFDRILGGGIVKGSTIFIAGDPGIGKSTLLLQIALNLKKNYVLYISGEENEKQIKYKANRLNIDNYNCLLLFENNLEKIIEFSIKINPILLIIDSIQTLYTSNLESNIGSIIQIRQCTYNLSFFAKKKNISIILIGHITKDGLISGPKIIEHIVDVVLQFNSDYNNIYKILRVKKNRFGPISEIGIYKMKNSGLKRVDDPSKSFYSKINFNNHGHTMSIILEGIRSILIEVQALVSYPLYEGIPERSSIGFDKKRLNMLLAILEKRFGFKKLRINDIFLNIIGGIRITDTSLDLALIVAIISSYKEIPISKNNCFSGEIDLNGEIRPIKNLNKIILEAERLGFKNIFISSYSKIDTYSKISVITLKKIEEIINKLF